MKQSRPPKRPKSGPKAKARAVERRSEAKGPKKTKAKPSNAKGKARGTKAAPRVSSTPGTPRKDRPPREEPGRQIRTPKRAIPIKQNKAYRLAMKERDRGEGTPFEAYFTAKPLGEDQPTLVFQHLLKTAGTAMRQIIHANLAGDDVEHIVLDVPQSNHEGTPLREWYDNWWESLPGERRSRLLLAVSHSANYLIPRIDRPSRAFTILREPFDRVLSRYYFITQRPEWTIADIYRKPPRHPALRAQFFNYQSRALLEPHFEVDHPDLEASMGPPPHAEIWRERLRAIVDEHYLVGVQDHFLETVKMFAREFHWDQVMTPRVRVNRDRPREWDDEETRELALAYNWLDVELHREHAEKIVSEESSAPSLQADERPSTADVEARKLVLHAEDQPAG